MAQAGQDAGHLRMLAMNGMWTQSRIQHLGPDEETCQWCQSGEREDIIHRCWGCEAFREQRLGAWPQADQAWYELPVAISAGGVPPKMVASLEGRLLWGVGWGGAVPRG